MPALSDGGAPYGRALFVSHPVFRRPAFGKHHPLSIDRMGILFDLCAALGWLEPDSVREASFPDSAILQRFHAPTYLATLEGAATTMSATPDVRLRFNLGTMECPLFEGLWDRARASVGGSILAADLALAGHRPFHPGGGTHHGRPDRASGFCYLNDPVFAILRLLDAGLHHVVYVDLDAHHGDGVEDAFVHDERVSLASVHEADRWPGTGQIDKRADRRILNVPLPSMTNDDEFLFATSGIYARLSDRCADAVVVTCGADALRGDPLSCMQVSNGALVRAVEAALRLAPRAVVLGGGGYNPWTAARFWALLWGHISGRVPPTIFPIEATQLLAGLHCDLVDADDRDTAWLDRLVDAPNNGPVRSSVAGIVAAALG